MGLVLNYKCVPSKRPCWSGWVNHWKRSSRRYRRYLLTPIGMCRRFEIVQAFWLILGKLLVVAAVWVQKAEGLLVRVRVIQYYRRSTLWSIFLRVLTIKLFLGSSFLSLSHWINLLPTVYFFVYGMYVRILMGLLNATYFKAVVLFDLQTSFCMKPGDNASVGGRADTERSRIRVSSASWGYPWFRRAAVAVENKADWGVLTAVRGWNCFHLSLWRTQICWTVNAGQICAGAWIKH